MSTESETVIAIAMMIAEQNGYPTDAWRLFQTEARAALTKMQRQHPPRPAA
jgi:hypothetical protein